MKIEKIKIIFEKEQNTNVNDVEDEVYLFVIVNFISVSNKLI